MKKLINYGTFLYTDYIDIRAKRYKELLRKKELISKIVAVDIFKCTSAHNDCDDMYILELNEKFLITLLAELEFVYSDLKKFRDSFYRVNKVLLKRNFNGTYQSTMYLSPVGYSQKEMNYIDEVFKEAKQKEINTDYEVLKEVFNLKS